MSENYPPTTTVTVPPPDPGDTAFTGGLEGAAMGAGVALVFLGVVALAAVSRRARRVFGERIEP